MELRDYLAALRRYWRTWLGVTLAAVSLAFVAVLSIPSAYRADATVFVAGTSVDGTNAAQFIRQRVLSYPDVARSEAVLGPVIESMDLSTSVEELRTRVSAENPLDSSQIDITVTDGDPRQAAAVANEIADEFSQVVEDLERPADGDAPVRLTVTDPANVPSAPVSPQRGLLLGLGLVVGLALGAAAAVLRSRTDSRVHTEDDVRAVWDGGADLAVITAPSGRRRTAGLAGRPESGGARRLAAAAGGVPVRAVVLGAAPGQDQVARSFAEKVTAELVDGGIPASLTGAATAAEPVRQAGVHLTTASPSVPLSEWRRLAAGYDGVLLVVESGRVDRADLREIRATLTAIEARVLAVVLLPRGSATGTADGPLPQAPAGDDLTRPIEPVAVSER